MISQNCPKCFSGKVRRGYKSTPFYWKILFRYNLLCDNCNWEFMGFAVPTTVTTRPKNAGKKKRKTHNLIFEAKNLTEDSGNSSSEKFSSSDEYPVQGKKLEKKRVRIKKTRTKIIDPNKENNDPQPKLFLEEQYQELDNPREMISQTEEIVEIGKKKETMEENDDSNLFVNKNTSDSNIVNKQNLIRVRRVRKKIRIRKRKSQSN